MLQKGFTLIELLVVLAVLVIMSLIIIPKIMNITVQSRDQNNIKIISQQQEQEQKSPHKKVVPKNTIKENQKQL